MTRVLVIDDDEWLARLFMRRLEHNGMVVQSAPNAIEALDLIDSFRPAVIARPKWFSAAARVAIV